MRVDLYLVERNLFDSRTKASESIKRGEIFIDGVKINKVSLDINETKQHNIERFCEDFYVSNGGFKMKKALTDFSFDVKNIVAADVGSSTGGFTQCLLKEGAKSVYAVDLNDGLLHQTLKDDERVHFIMKNAKDLNASDFNENIDLLVADLSFISITQVLKVFYNLIDFDKNIIILIKPQFENEKKIKLKNGIVNDKKMRLNTVKKVFDYAISCGFTPKKITTAPVKQGKNVEYLILLEKGQPINVDFNVFIKDILF